MGRPLGHILDSDKNVIRAMVDPDAINNGYVQAFQFVYTPVKQGHLVFRIKSIEDGDTLPKTKKISEINRMQSDIKAGQNVSVDPTILEQTYKVLVLDPIGIIGKNGALDAYNGGVGTFQPVYETVDAHIKALYQAKEGLQVGWVAEGTEKTTVPFYFTREDSSKHTLIVGKNGTGKTNLLKTMIWLNAQSDEPMSMLVFGHRDLGEDNPNDEETKGLINLNHENIFHFGYRNDLKVAPGEVNRQEVLQAFEWTPTQRHVINHMYDRDPHNALMQLANYEVDVDPYNIVKKSYKVGRGSAASVRHQGFARADSIGVIVRNLRELYRIVDEKTDPLLPELVKIALRKKIALVDTSKLNPEQTVLMLKLMLQRMKTVGLTSIGHKRAPMRLCVIIDEAQIYMKLLGEHAVDFAKECRKAGISLILGTQNVSIKAVPAELKGEIHNIISLQLSPANANDLQAIMPEFADLTDVITRRPIGTNKGQICAVTNSYPFAVVGKCDRFEDIDDIVHWVPPTDIHDIDAVEESEEEIELTADDWFADDSDDSEEVKEPVIESVEDSDVEVTVLEEGETRIPIDPFDDDEEDEEDEMASGRVIVEDEEIEVEEDEEETFEKVSNAPNDVTKSLEELERILPDETEEIIEAELPEDKHKFDKLESLTEDIESGFSDLEESIFDMEEDDTNGQS